MKNKIPRSGYEKVGGLVFFGRTLDKIRLNEEGSLPPDYNLGHGLDERIVRFLGIEYEDIIKKVRSKKSDEEILEWCFKAGRKPNDEEIVIFNHFMEKRGLRDDISDWVVDEKKRLGREGCDYIQTVFDVHDAEEGRSPRYSDLGTAGNSF